MNRPMRTDDVQTPSGVTVRLRLARHMRGMTLKELARLAGCSESLLS